MKVFYRPEQATRVDSFSPSSAKPRAVMERWTRRLGDRIQVMTFEPATPAELSSVHAARYVDDVLAIRTENGFGTRDAAVAEAVRFTTGSMRAATLAALKDETITVSPTSGFHHAGFDDGRGFCTFNGLMVAARAALANGATRVGIVDCDQHYGDGTQEIIDRLRWSDRVRHWTLGARRYADQDAALDALAEEMEACVRQCDVILYQAGADSHVDDPLGGVFDTDGYRTRDRLVFTAAVRARKPLSWNLAGGYATRFEDVLDLHDITMDEALKALAAG